MSPEINTESPPTPEATTEIHTGIAPIPIDPGKDVLSQLVSHVATLGRTLEGLTYKSDGLDFVVDNVAVLRENIPYKKMRKVLPSFSRQLGGSHSIELIPEDTAYVTLKGYGPDGKLSTRQDFRGPSFGYDKKGASTTLVSEQDSDFGKMLNDLVRQSVEHDGLVPVFRLKELEDEPASFRTVPVDLSDKDKSVFDTVMDLVKTENLSDGWVGLTWTRDGFVCRITEDNARSWDGSDATRNLREWVVETLDTEGRVLTRTSMNGEKMRKYLQVMNTPPNPPLNDLRFVAPSGEEAPRLELPPEDPFERLHWREERAWLGWLGTAHPDEPETIAEEGLSFEDAVDMLSYGDVYDRGGEVHQRITNRVRSSVQDRKYIKTLQGIVGEIGSHELWDVADRQLAHYNSTLKMLGLRPRLEDQSISWVFKELARHRYFSKNPDDVPGDVYHDLEFQDPIGADGDAKLGLNNVIDLRLGAIFVNTALHKEEEPIKKVEKIPESRRGPDGNEFQEVIKSRLAVSVDEKMVRLLQTFIRDEVAAILNKAVTGRRKPVGEPITQYDMARIGELLRQATGQ